MGPSNHDSYGNPVSEQDDRIPRAWPQNRMSPVEHTLRSTQDAYPADLARFVLERWDEDRAGALPDQGRWRP